MIILWLPLHYLILKLYLNSMFTRPNVTFFPLPGKDQRLPAEGFCAGAAYKGK